MDGEGSKDLLIFKLRGQGVTETEKKGEAPKKEYEPAVIKHENEELAVSSPPPEPQLPRMIKKAEPKKIEMEEAPKPEEKAVISEAKPVPEVKPMPELKLTPQAEAPEEETFIVEAPKPQESPKPPAEEKKETMKAEVASPITKIMTKRAPRLKQKGATCSNHPWRPAFATCESCKLSYCYADIMEYRGRYYCLKDIDNAVGSKASTVNTKSNMFEMMAAVTFLAIGILLGYFMYPQAVFLSSFLRSEGVILSINNILSASFYVTAAKAIFAMATRYYTPMANILVAFLSFVSVFLIFRHTDRSFTFVTLFNAIALVVLSYQYVNSPALYSPTLSNVYLVLSSGFLFVNFVFLAFSRSSGFTEIRKQVSFVPQIDWPNVETF